MKKILLIICVLLLLGCSKLDIKSIDKLISYKVLDNYVEVDNASLNDETIIQKNYSSSTGDGYFQAEIFSYKNKDPFNPDDYSLDENDYITTLSDPVEMTIDNKTFYIGYSSQDDMDKVNAKAYVRKGNYVFVFTMSNFDNPITDEQFEDFLKMIQSVKFKY